MYCKNFLIFTILLSLFSCNTQKNEQDKKAENKTISFAMTTEPNTMDPRAGRSLYFVQFIQLLYEGLMRQDASGRVVPAAAESVSFTPDLKTYTFKLRDAKWSNGEPVTSYDFAYALKTQLQPDFPAPNVSQLYNIAGAKEAKEGLKALDEVGIETPDAKTLIIKLQNPHPYFLEIAASHIMFPVYQPSDKQYPNWPDGPADKVITNGPFALANWKHGHEITLKKNPYYWNEENVLSNPLSFMVLDGNTSLQLFQQGQLDWIGSPLSMIQPEAIETLQHTGQLETAPAAGTYWLRVNTASFPLSNSKLRQALSYAINRRQIVNHIVQGGNQPATGIIPPSLTDYHEPYFIDHDTVAARQLFQEALEELNLTIDNFPKITLYYGVDDFLHKIAQVIQEEWQKTFPVPSGTFVIQKLEPKILFEKVSHKDYQLALGSWFADFRDPINFLDVFKTKQTSTNNTNWENPKYISLLESADIERDPFQRKQILAEAEKLLISEMPVIPLYFASYRYAKNPFLQGTHIVDLGYMDLKEAYIGPSLETIADE